MPKLFAMGGSKQVLAEAATRGVSASDVRFGTARATIFILLLSALLVGCATVQQEMGPQTFSEPDIPIAGGEDAGVLLAVEAAVSVSSEFGFRHDASGSRKGRVDVHALWKGRPVTLKMRFQRRDASGLYREGIYISSLLTQPADVAMGSWPGAKGGGQKLERLFYSRLFEVTTQLGLEIYGDPTLDPELMD